MNEHPITEGRDGIRMEVALKQNKKEACASYIQNAAYVQDLPYRPSTPDFINLRMR